MFLDMHFFKKIPRPCQGLQFFLDARRGVGGVLGLEKGCWQAPSPWLGWTPPRGVGWGPP